MALLFVLRFSAGWLDGDTIARKPQHDKATCRVFNHVGLELRRPDRHCVIDLIVHCRPEI
jgi:hypothetical protein